MIMFLCKHIPVYVYDYTYCSYGFHPCRNDIPIRVAASLCSVYNSQEDYDQVFLHDVYKLKFANLVARYECIQREEAYMERRAYEVEQDGLIVYIRACVYTDDKLISLSTCVCVCIKPALVGTARAS